jgi:hypothetical protein
MRANNCVISGLDEVSANAKSGETRSNTKVDHIHGSENLGFGWHVLRRYQHNRKNQPSNRNLIAPVSGASLKLCDLWERRCRPSTRIE